MIITVKNLQQQTFTIEFDQNKTVLELKKKIYEERGAEYIAEKQKLIYAGVILIDERTIKSYDVDEKKFIVVMLTRDASARQTETDTTNKIPKDSKVATAGNVEKSEIKHTEDLPRREVSPTTAAVPPPRPISNSDLIGELANASLQSRAESNLIMGDEYNQTVLSMVEMGYPREQVERAMAASFNNPERAVEYLINGLPAEDGNLFNVNEEAINPSLIQVSGQSNISAASTGERPTESNSDPFEFLRSQPQFLQMRSLIYQNPHLLHAVLQQIGQTNPALLQLISENQDAFLNMLNQPIEGETDSGSGDSVSRVRNPTQISNIFASADAQEEEGRGTMAAGRNPTDATENLDFEQQPPGAGVATIRINPQDQGAIERLKALGFPEALVLQAYFACEKDEELAANFLLSSSFDD
ncbi:UV excision repair protein RAD23 homolog A [Drosophila kikkawai]|uniref:UV excision repair protein RAD23 n=1 Tax=Drosophila kikkawai TaxID=30033 RepID=A0A6P4I999_DROKI|nr:UV excision repair protein RAD23 homolog A [Drosophila kikkawai]